ncbi:hypothetical protein IJ425_07920 [bacterium]|nr:hypothetical protein [bacterium]
MELLFRTEKNITFDALNVENLSEFCSIEEMEKKLEIDPDDYILNIRLAQAYESLGELDRANEFYKNALKLSNRSNLALYSYALFCAKNDLYVFAATLAEELDGNSKKINLFKAKIYEHIGDSLSRQKNYPASVKSYQIAQKYAKSIGDRKFLNTINQKYSEEYIKLADYNVEKSEVLEATSNLENSLKIKKSAIANYKLGLIYMNNDLTLAEKYMNKAFSMDLYVINPYIYNSILTKLIDEAKLLGNDGLINYYSSKLKRFKIALNKGYLYKNQVLIDNSALISKKTFLNDLKYFLYFEVKNNTEIQLDNLYLKAELFVNGQRYVMEKKIISQVNSLEPYSDFAGFNFALPNNIQFNNLKQNNDIFVRFYAKKIKSAPWVLTKIDFLNI